MGAKLFGTTGKILRVDLTQEKVWEEFLKEEELHKFVGGTALGVKFLYDMIPPEIQWSDPSNCLYIGSGPLGGTKVAGSGCFSVVTKGAMTNGVASSQANGFLGAYLKFSGFDGILIQGAASNWKYLYIHNGIAELRDARYLMGKDTWDTEDLIKKELGLTERKMSVFSIGPAGENLVRFAGIFGDRGHTAPHNGVGAVMGAKKLKAIAVARSAGKVPVADAEKVSNAAKQLIEVFKNAMNGEIYNWGTSRLVPGALKGGILPVKNYTTNLFPEAEKFSYRDRFEATKFPCWACPSSHHMHIRVTEGPYAGFFGKEPEYEQNAAWGPQIGQTDPGATVLLANESDRLGFDCNEGSWVVGWIMECYEKGILTAKDLDGLEMTWGNVEATRQLFRNIAYRRGFGDVLAEGVRRAAEKIGGEAVNMAIYTMRGNTPRGHDHRGKWWEMFDTCVSESATLQNQLLMLDLKPYEISSFDPFSWKDVSTVVGKTTGTLTFVDSLVICWFACAGNIPLLCEALNGATGWNFNFDEALRVGRRALNLMRIYNVRSGLTPELDYPSSRYGSTPQDGPQAGKSNRPYWQEMLKNYYGLMGWNPDTGLPLPQTMKKLGLGNAIDDLNKVKI